MRLLVVLSVLWFGAVASAQCPPSAGATGACAQMSVQVQVRQTQPMTVYRLVPEVQAPAPTVEYRYFAVPSAPLFATPVYAAPAPRVEYRVGPFGRVRRIIVGG